MQLVGKVCPAFISGTIKCIPLVRDFGEAV